MRVTSADIVTVLLLHVG